MNHLLILAILSTTLFAWLSGYYIGRAVESRRWYKEPPTKPTRVASQSKP
jgi:hypothetical protein